VVDDLVPGLEKGRAGLARHPIRNYPGFAQGVTGAGLVLVTYQQA
jgi:hypothetical protein